MIKIVALIRRKPDFSFEQFSDYYLHRHAKLCWSLAPPEVAERVVLYSQSHARALGRGPASAPFDCVTEIGFADEDGLRAWNEWYLGPDAAELRADEANFMDTSQRVVVVTDELTPPQPSGALPAPRRSPSS